MAGVFHNKVAVVTGGASGLGAALAQELASEGAVVVIADIALDEANAVAAKIGAHAIALDVTNVEQMALMVQNVKSRFGALDLFFNNAGVMKVREACNLTFGEYDQVFRVNLMGVIAGSLSAFKVMKEQKSGKIVNIASSAVFTCDPFFGAYVASKSGVFGFSRVLAVEAEPHNVQVSVICPGNIRTPMLDGHEPSWLTPAIAADAAARKILTGIRRNRKIIVFPSIYRLMWWVDRLSPSLLNPLRRIIVQRALARKRDSHDRTQI
jgi:NAD(P)-dependent dehydrogenase (short-subunit alcohol dehydrogenase family)